LVGLVWITLIAGRVGSGLVGLGLKIRTRHSVYSCTSSDDFVIRLCRKAQHTTFCLQPHGAEDPVKQLLNKEDRFVMKLY